VQHGRIPLVSCIMPTRDRRHFAVQAVKYFLSQGYPNRELIVVDDGADQIADLVASLAAVRYLQPRLRMSVGAKRNLACAAASGSLIMHWDDDDWMAPWRIEYQVRALLDQRVQVCGLRKLVHLDPVRQLSWIYTYPTATRPWIAGGTFCYRKSLWERSPFPDVNVGEDTAFLWRGRPGRVLAMPNSSFYVAVLHPGNTSPKHTGDPWWRSIDPEPVVERMGKDWTFYAELPALLMGPQ
jgi:glycosyltransferase involved in cell wall biosynthesis